MAHTHDDSPRFPSDRSERAKEMVKAGLIGGAGRGQGRKPKARSAGAEVADLAARETDAIKKAYSKGLRSTNERTAILAAEKLLAAEKVERERKDYEAELRRLSGPELDRAFLQALVNSREEDGTLPLDVRLLLTEADLDPDLVEQALPAITADVVDGQAWEIPPESLNGNGATA